MRRAALVGAAVVAAGVLVLVWLLTRPGPPPRPQGAVRVAAAADLKFALDDAVTAFRARHPDIEVQVTYGASGNFYAQLSNRAPFDLFLSADIDYPRKLVEQGLADRDSEFLYAVGHLVLWVPNSSPLDVQGRGIDALLDPSIKKIAIANPKHAPYGRAAEAALKSLGVYDRVKEQLVLGENVAQAAQFAQTGAADAGVFALSLALAPPLRNDGRYWEVPPDAYPRLEQGGVILTWAQDRPAAEALRSFLTGDEGRAILKRYGFVLPGG
ncbi:MAG TPA: molybdate ABC transporter substrate-binding protein [Gemmataceae bacterium]|nr:molybdate ABC transporter substrate-binding protein [Gemmataceae bacterium]